MAVTVTYECDVCGHFWPEEGVTSPPTTWPACPKCARKGPAWKCCPSCNGEGYWHDSRWAPQDGIRQGRLKGCRRCQRTGRIPASKPHPEG